MLLWRKLVSSLALGILLMLSVTGMVEAAQSSSTNYQVNEVMFGSGGELNACSSQYCAKESLGETTVGNTKSTNYQAQGGFNTDRTPSIEFVVNAATIDLGVLKTNATATASVGFSVKSYLSDGYSVVNASDPPSYAGYTLANLTTPTASAAGTEQFGINLVSNTTGCGAPANFGANPVQVPSSVYSFGTVASGYNTCGQFKYVKGDVIASSPRSSGETDYTVSYIFNISNTTPAGLYTFNHILVATATY